MPQLYDQDEDNPIMDPAHWPSFGQTAKWWASRAYELESTLIDIYVKMPVTNDAALIAYDAVQRFERTVLGDE
jgi:hypothetical protein